MVQTLLHEPHPRRALPNTNIAQLRPLPAQQVSDPSRPLMQLIVTFVVLCISRNRPKPTKVKPTWQNGALTFRLRSHHPPFRGLANKAPEKAPSAARRAHSLFLLPLCSLGQPPLPLVVTGLIVHEDSDPRVCDKAAPRLQEPCLPRIRESPRIRR